MEFNGEIYAGYKFSYHYPDVLCVCGTFLEDLLTFIRNETYEQELKWETFIDFLNHYSHHVNNAQAIFAEPCSYMVCKIFLGHLQYREKISGLKLLEEIFHVICLIYFNKDSSSTNCVLGIYVTEGSIWQFGSYGNEAMRTFIALDGKREYMTLLVNFDLISSLNNSKDHVPLYCNPILYIHSPTYTKFGFVRILNEILWTMDGDFENKYAKQRVILKMAKSLFLRINYGENFKRIYLTMHAIHAAQLSLRKDKRAEDYIYCLRMFFTATREPFITINEFRITLYACLHVQENLPFFQSYYEEFLKILPECSTKFEPRKLTDLVRCAIRENLKQCNLPLPVAVSKINLATTMREFILGNVIQMSRDSGIVDPKLVITETELEILVFECSKF